MSIQALQAATQDSGIYQIHKKTEAQNTEQVQSEQVVQEVPQTDEYDKANPVGEEAEGIYSVSYDEDGSLKVDYKQPASKQEGAGQAGGGQAAGGQAVNSTDSDDDTEEEIEKLKQQREQIKQQLNKEKDEDTRKVLRTQLQAIEAQIAQKTAELKA